MTVMMGAMHRALPPNEREPLPPRQITQNAAAAAGVALGADEETREAATLATHFGYGASAGSLYAPFAGSTRLPPVVEGALYGMLVWGGSYLGILPGAGLYRSAKDETAGRNALMMSAHLVWGASLGLLVNAIANNDQRSR
jgi:hypothetical protein